MSVTNWQVLGDHVVKTEETNSTPDHMMPYDIEKKEEPETQQLSEPSEDPEPKTIKEEQIEQLIFENEGQLVVKQETSTNLLSPVCEEMFLDVPKGQWTVEMKEELGPGEIKDEQEDSETLKIKMEPQPMKIKEESGDFCSDHDEKQLLVKQESEIIMVTHFDEKENNKTEPNKDQLLFANHPEAENRHWQEDDQNVSGSSRDKGLKKHQDFRNPKDCVDKPELNETDLPSCEICGKRFNTCNDVPARTRSHTKNKSSPGKVCSNCKGHSYNLTFNQKTQTGEKPFSCGFCDKSFRDRNDLVCHTRTHTNVMSYSCDLCDKSFKIKSVLVGHRRTHTGEKPYSCDFCDKSFKVKGQLICHTKTHTNERSYSCDLCDKTFKTRGVLVGHRRTHTGERPYSCDLCDKSFTDCSALSNHKKTHTGEKPFSCDLCDKSFSLKISMVNHRKIHTGEKPHSCDVCGKSFRTKSCIIRHIRTHTGLKLYSCDLCDKSFGQSSILKRHQRVHTGEKA